MCFTCDAPLSWQEASVDVNDLATVARFRNTSSPTFSVTLDPYDGYNGRNVRSFFNASRSIPRNYRIRDSRRT
jgi:hypothetical protein